MNLNVNSQTPTQNATQAQTAAKANAAPKEIDSTLEKMGHAIHEHTKDGTFVGDNMLLTGAGALVGTVAAGSAVKKTADAIPAVKEALRWSVWVAPS